MAYVPIPKDLNRVKTKDVYLEQEKKNSANKTHAKRKGIEKSKAGLKEK